MPASSITIRTPYALSTTEAQKNGAVFMSLRNNESAANKILGASTDVAEKVELHEQIMEGRNDAPGMYMMMRPVDSIALPPGEVVSLNPMGTHIMLIGLKKPLVFEESFTLHLNFETGSEDVIVKIEAPGFSPPEDSK